MMSVKGFVCAAAFAAGSMLLAAAPAAAQWRNYDGYQYAPADPVYPAYPAYQRAPAYDPDDGYDAQDQMPAPRRGRVDSQRAYPDSDLQYDTPTGVRSRRQPADGQSAYPAYADPGASADPASRDDLDLNGISPRHTAEVVPNPTHEKPGTIVIDTRSKHLYLVENDGNAVQYGIGVGRQGFAWKGEAHVARKAEWPAWYPPADMIKRRPDLPNHMEGGIENPLGARALYLYKGNKDTLFRIHGTNEPDTIGKAVSSGCIRMMNADVVDLYKRVPVGTKVVVL